MSFLIAITGKGGVGKTTVAALLVHRLIARGGRPVLAVDADPNSCLDATLGVHAVGTVGGVRETTRQIASDNALPVGISKPELLRLKIAESLTEADDFDLIAMGRPEGPGCYCYANNVLKQALAEMVGTYPYVVVDNEAGLENLSRRLVQKADLMIMVTDPSRRGLDTVRRLHALTREMGVEYKQLAVVVNRLRHDIMPAEAEALRADTGAAFLVGLPDDDAVAAIAEAGRSLRELSAENPVVARLDALLAQAVR